VILYLPEPFELSPVDKKTEQSFVLKLPSGGELVVESCGQNQVRVVDIRSTEPMDFIDQKIQPGSIIELRPNF
jgi:hypothetical protein